MATMQQQGTIGGLPASMFIGHHIKVMWGDRSPHPTPAKCIAVEAAGNVVVAINNGSGIRSVKVACSQCRPWWSKNPELKAIAESKGAVYEGPVSVGRAFESAIQTAVKTYERPEAPPSEIEITLVETIHPQPRVEIETPPVVEITKQPETPMEQPELPLENPAYQPSRTLLKLEIPAASDGSWVSDMQEFYRIYGILSTGPEELEDLRKKIAALQRELQIKQEEADKNREDNQVMLELLVEQLTSKGVVFQWDGNPEKAVAKPAPSKITAGNKPPKTAKATFYASLRKWLREQKQPFTYLDVFPAIGFESTRARRDVVKDCCAGFGIKCEQHRGSGKKTTFIP